MSKRAKEAARKAYPKEEGKMYSTAFGTFEFDRNAAERKGFQEGYEQAEKDIKNHLLEPFLSAAKDLVDAVERYTRQECLRSELLNKKNTLKEILNGR